MLDEQAQATVLIRPEQLRLVAPSDGVVTGRVASYEYFGHDAVVRVAAEVAGDQGERGSWS